MYLGSKRRRRSPRLTIFLLLLILIATVFVRYIANNQPEWAKPFEPTPIPTRSAQSYAAEAEAYYNEGQLDEAIASYQQVLAINPEDPMAYVRLAGFLILRERTAEAVQQAKEAVLLEPSDPQALAILCRALDWEGQYTQAFEVCECAIEIDPDYAEAYAYLAEVYADTGAWRAARQYAQQAIDLDYQSMDAHRNQGYALEMQGRFREAAEAYENAIFLHPKMATLYNDVGRNYRAMGKFTDAVDRFEKVIRLDPASPVGYDQLGWTYYAAGEYARAQDNLEQAILVDPDYAASWGHLGIVNYALQQYEEAIVPLQQTVRLAEKDHMRDVRQVIVIGQDTTYDPPYPIERMRGDFYPFDRRGVDTLEVHLSPVLQQRAAVPQRDRTCGDLIAAELGPSGPDEESRPADTELAETIEPDIAFLNATGHGTLDVNEGQLEIRLTNIPQPAGIPYVAQLLTWPDTTTSIGYFQPDAQGNATISFTFEDVHTAPVEYYYTLGFSYVHLGQCHKGVPWLLTSIDIDPSVSNPAWQGLAQCPEAAETYQAPEPPPTLTPEPTETPEGQSPQ